MFECIHELCTASGTHFLTCPAPAEGSGGAFGMDRRQFAGPLDAAGRRCVGTVCPNGQAWDPSASAPSRNR